MENGWEKGQEWMGKGARMNVVRQIKRLLWKWEVGGLLNQGDIGGNTKKWADLENQQNQIAVFYGMWKKEI